MRTVAEKQKRRGLRAVRWWQWIGIGVVVLMVVAAPFAIPAFVTYQNFQAAAKDLAVPNDTVLPGTPTPTPKPEMSTNFDFSKLGNFGLNGFPDFSRPTTKEEAQKKLSFPLELPTYTPQGFKRQDSMNVLKRIGATFTPDVAKFRAFMRDQNIPLDIPDALNGKKITVYVGDLIVMSYEVLPNVTPAALTGSGSKATRLTVSATAAPEITMPPGFSRAEMLKGIAQLPIPDESQLPILYAQWHLIDPDNAAPLNRPASLSVTAVPLTLADGTSRQAQLYRDNLKGAADLTWERNGITYIIDGYINDAEMITIAQSFR